MKKVVLITGASRGIGSSTAELFAKNGYNVIINYNNSEEEAKTLQEKLISSYNVSVDTIKCDISNEEQVKNMIDFVIKKYDHIDCLINNASISDDMLFCDKTISSFKRVIDVNLVGTFIVSKYAYKYIKDSIINIGSTNGIDTYYPESIDYDCSKAGIISLTHNLAKELSPIRVNCICPGWVNTNMNKDLNEEQMKEINNNILLKRFASPDEIAKVIYFVANDATYINNSVIRVDGGELC